MTDEIKNKIVNILKECDLYKGEIKSFKREHFDEIFSNIDSLNYVNFVVRIENAFSIDLPDDMLLPESIKSYENFVKVLEELL